MAGSVRTRRADGFLLTELIVSITVVGLIVIGLAVSMQGAAAFNRYQWSRPQCVAAARAQLDCLTATGTFLPEEQMQRLWPKVTVTVARSAGQGQWAGLELVQATATMRVTPHPTEVRLARYVQPAGRTGAEGASL